MLWKFATNKIERGIEYNEFMKVLEQKIIMVEVSPKEKFKVVI